MEPTQPTQPTPTAAPQTSSPLSIADFSAKVKSKYPEYKDIPDQELAQKIFKKYPDYEKAIDPSALAVFKSTSGIIGPGSEVQRAVSDTASEAVKGTIEDYKQAIPNFIAAAQSSDTKNPIVKGGEDVLAATASGLGTVFAPITEAIKASGDKFSDTAFAQNLAQHPTVGKILDFFQGLGDKWNDVAKKDPQAAKDIENSLAVLTASMAEEPAKNAADKVADVTGKAAKKTSDIVSGGADAASKIPGKVLRKVVPLPPDISDIVKNPEDAKAAADKVRELQQQGQAVQKNPRALSPKQSEANSLFGDSKGGVFDAIDTGAKNAGTKMGAALDNPAVGSAKVDISSVFKDVQASIKKGVTGLTSSQRNDLGQFGQDIQGLQSASQAGKLTLKDVDSFLRDWQPNTSKYQGTSLGRVINEAVHNINQLALSTADSAEEAAGVEGHPYRESNDEYRQYITAKGALSDARGSINPTTGRYATAHQILQQVTNPDSAMKETFDQIDQLVGDQTKTGGLSMSDRAGLATFIQDIYTGVSPKTAISNLPSMGFGAGSALYRVLRNITVKATTNPDVVVSKILDVLEKGQK